MKAMNLIKSIVILILTITAFNCCKKTKKPIIITYENYNLYVYPNNNAEGIHWEEAKNLCDGLEAFGYSDWYLPTIEELETMNDSIDGMGAFKPYWSSTETSDTTAYVLLTGVVDTQIVKRNKNERGTSNIIGGFISVPVDFRCRCVRKDK
jgi:hypothetical protein